MFLALGIQHAMRMLCVFVCGLPDSTVFFHIVPTKQHDFRKKNWKSVFWFSLQIVSETVLIKRIIERDMIKNLC